MSEKNCTNCDHFDQDDDSWSDARGCFTSGECRRNPPQIVVAEWVGNKSDERYVHHGLWPQVMCWDWCGEFSPESESSQ